jgi:hypothetical protein
MKYRIGDKVRIKGKKELHEIYCFLNGSDYFIEEWGGKDVTISEICSHLSHLFYRIEGDADQLGWYDRDIEGLVEEKVEKEIRFNGKLYVLKE